MRDKLDKLIAKKEFRTFLLFSTLLIFGFLFGANFNKIAGPQAGLEGLTKSDSINAENLKEILSDEDPFLLNVHTPYEGEIPMTDMFLEYNYIMANKNKLPEDKSTPIIVYCQTGRMSGEALKTLKSLGYKNVKHLAGGMVAWEKKGYEKIDLSNLSSQVLPEEGFELPISWNEYGKRLVDIGVIDIQKLEGVMVLTDEQKAILNGDGGKVTINSQNSRFVVNLLWAFGLAQKSKVYEEGPMGQEYKDRIGNFASTGGWNLAKGKAVGYLGKYDLVDLSKEEQDRVSEIAKNVYRPCCGNNTWFPDCNHGMAALAAIELMVVEGYSDDEIYRNLLSLNSYWFPSTYLQIATHFSRQGVMWDNVDAKVVLGENYSSANGARAMAEKVGPLPYDVEGVGGSCGA